MARGVCGAHDKERDLKRIKGSNSAVSEVHFVCLVS